MVRRCHPILLLHQLLGAVGPRSRERGVLGELLLVENGVVAGREFNPLGARAWGGEQEYAGSDGRESQVSHECGRAKVTAIRHALRRDRCDARSYPACGTDGTRTLNT